MGASDSSPSVQELFDRVEIDELLSRYSMAVDDGSWDQLDSVFSESARIDYTSSGGIAGKRDEIKRWLAVALEPFPVRQHIIGNKRVVIDGDVAEVRAYYFNPMYLREADGALRYAPGGGYYNHRLVREPVGWRSHELFEDEVWREGLSGLAIPTLDDA